MVDSMKKYDLHVHTSFSPCSMHKVEDVLTEARKKVDGLAITDHNTINGALKAFKLNNQLNKKNNTDLKVIIGEEILTPYGEILAYGLNSEVKPGLFYDVLDKIKSQGAVCSIAHPFDFIRKKYVLKNFMTAIETFNGRSAIIPNLIAKNTAISQKLTQTGGSDSHLPGEIGNGYTLFSGDIISAIKKGKTMTSGKNFAFINSYSRSIYYKLTKKIDFGKKFQDKEIEKIYLNKVSNNNSKTIYNHSKKK